ncbi:MAG: DUF4838 domain-containing protein [Oscillospiraceae bacterium]|nr:DUF4838 domain-containing protein [Oscillospiraceae bacterium]
MATRILRSCISLILGAIFSVTAVHNPAKILKADPPLPETVQGETFSLTGDYVIVSAGNRADCTYNAAVILQNYLRQITGLELPIVPDTQTNAKEIVVGPTARQDGVDYGKLGDDGICIRTAPERILITGGAVRGTMYAVYTFLEDCFNCRWYTEKLTVIPTTDDPQIPVYEKTFVPTFEFRETDWISPNRSANKEYSCANRLNGGPYRTLSAQEGGTVDYIGSFAHTLTTQFCAADTYFEAHPEWFAMDKDGKRIPDQLCLSNPETLATVTREVLDAIRENPTKKIVSLTQNDNQKYCRCAQCAATDTQEGSPSGTLLRFVNAVAEAVEDAGFTNVEIDTFAYQYTRKPPKITVPRQNVIVRLCSIECCFAHPLNDPLCTQNVKFSEDIVRWSEICERLYVWDYTTNYSNYLGPFPNFGVMQENMRFFAEHHVVGVYEEGNYTARESDAEFAELRAYLLSKLMWDPDMDYEREMNGFLRAYYGENSWQYVRAYIDKTTQATGRFGLKMGIYAAMTDKSVLLLTGADRRYMDLLWSKAKENAETDAQLEHIRRSELSWRYWKACNKYGEFSALRPQKRIEANKALYADFVELGIKRICEGSGGLLSDSPDFREIPRGWTKK